MKIKYQRKWPSPQKIQRNIKKKPYAFLLIQNGILHNLRILKFHRRKPTHETFWIHGKIRLGSQIILKWENFNLVCNKLLLFLILIKFMWDKTILGNICPFMCQETNETINFSKFLTIINETHVVHRKLLLNVYIMSTFS